MTPDPLRETVLSYLAEQLQHEDSVEKAVLIAKAEAILATLNDAQSSPVEQRLNETA
ncbi:hypothetical protein BH11PLA2_BH11PLA2_14050 [soil metagenome]